MAKKTTKKQQVTATKNQSAVEKVATLQVDKVLSGLTSAGLNIQGTLSKVGEDIMQQFSQLDALKTAITVKKAEMEELHGKDKILLTIDELNAEHQQTVDSLAKEVEDLQQANTRAQEAENERRAREQEEFEYQLAQSRKKDSDAWAEDVRIRQRDEQIRREQFEKEFKLREEQLALKEKAYSEALAKAASFDQDVETRVKAEVAKVTSAMNKDFTHSSQMTAVQHKAEVDRLTMQNTTFQQALTSKDETIKQLTEQLKSAYEKNAELAKAAVDGAANSKAQSEAMAMLTSLGSSPAARAKS